MDQFDQAQELEQLQRQTALARHQAKAAQEVIPGVLDGICADCDEVIDPRRMAALPGCQRCLVCQSSKERRPC